MDYLYPDARNLNNPPAFIKRDTNWVSKVMGSVHHTPFSRIKSTFANITKDEARAKGYVKGKKKVEEVITLLKRTTTPQTIYKKQKLDRDDVTDITDFDVVAWLKSEMRMMLDEEIARAILIGDGRNPADDDKISEDHVRSIANDEDLYTIAQEVSGADDDALYRDFIVQAIKARTSYKGSGNPTLFTTEDTLTNLLLLTDGEGRDLYDSVERLATKMRVKEIVTVEVMENAEDADGNEIMGLIVNMNDYNVGADKGGAVSMFDDFDIDYNQQKYLIETRCSGALIKPYSAIKLYKAGE
jgi:HK97 family phage major capsid protein